MCVKVREGSEVMRKVGLNIRVPHPFLISAPGCTVLPPSSLTRLCPIRL